MRTSALPKLAVVLGLGVALCGCGKAQPESPAQRYNVRGIIRGFAPDRSTVDIEHETIPDFMPSMTMPFRASDPKEIAQLRTGDAVAFQLEVTAKDFSIRSVKKINAAEVQLPKPVESRTTSNTSERLKEGDMLPPFSLTTEAGEPLTADMLRGHPTLITFIFTRCPMPNFCPRMSHNFADLQKAIANGSGQVAQTHLLSITIDPQFDTPAVLKAYAQQEGADANVWTFATGAAAQIDELTKSFAVYRQTEGGTITHGLATALISADGKIVKLWRGNGWTPEEVLAVLAHSETHHDLEHR